MALPAEKEGGMVVSLGLGKPKPKKSPMGGMEEAGSAEQDAVQAFFEAGQSGDFAAATEAFKTAYDLCSSAPAEEEEDEYPEDEESGF